MIYMMTISSDYVQAINSGRKIIELRKFVPRGMQRGDRVIVVEKCSDSKVALMFDVDGIILLPPSQMWILYYKELAMNYVDYLRYTDNCSLVYGIKIRNVRKPRYDVDCTYFGVKASPKNYERVHTSSWILASSFNLNF